jgi:hypothetical protein
VTSTTATATALVNPRPFNSSELGASELPGNGEHDGWRIVVSVTVSLVVTVLVVVDTLVSMDVTSTGLGEGHGVDDDDDDDDVSVCEEEEEEEKEGQGVGEGATGLSTLSVLKRLYIVAPHEVSPGSQLIMETEHWTAILSRSAVASRVRLSM